ncbi:MAG: pantoate--beta-alanine ligase [Acidimicrobiia bacterium]|nr:pantoate--beta-alanine ligase [Acidimicrobiia bacterium]MYC57640.1 pantoate--beta-alanine ligase [Acidimicrobiia bacterium]MYG94440.1 pantoate--beta-alanine ligase [Acidimicrobiia bacterium]MYI30707.1 pantoate--beta-alanine ligase [Acidimicrobiia bacterium]
MSAGFAIPVVHSASDLRAITEPMRAQGATVGLVPTMGYLHEGHQSLVIRSAAENDLTVVSIFVNPLQFAEGEDYSIYPRDLQRDHEMCAEVGAGLVFAPSAEEMYAKAPITSVAVQGFNAVLEGRFRPTHFDGVSTVVAKLFAMLGPDRAYFGEKDYQQLVIIRRMAFDLSFSVEVVGCPTLRESDGLAMSSRNVYLTASERSAATVLWRSLQAGREVVMAGNRDPDEVEAVMAAVIAAEPKASTDYAAVVHADTLERPEVLNGELRLLMAARIGQARLIDNIGVSCE